MVSDRNLSEVLSEFARIMLTDFPIQDILDKLVVRIVDILPVTSSGVTLIFPGSDPQYVAASDEAALRFEKLQSELAEGPCLAAYETGEAVAVPDLRADRRFPAFSPRGVEEGLAAVFTLPLRHGDAQLGALDLYRDTPGPLDDDTMVAAQTLADVTSAYLINARARADLRAACDRLREASLHDDLTGLANRVLLGQRLDVAIRRARRSPTVAAILFVDIDYFKAVNDTYGHQVGDQLLVAVAGRLSGLIRTGDTLARPSGDEFILLCEGLDDRSQASKVATRLGSAFAAPFVLSDTTVTVTASIGIAFAGRGDTIPERLLETLTQPCTGPSGWAALATRSSTRTPTAIAWGCSKRWASNRRHLTAEPTGRSAPQPRPMTALRPGFGCSMRWRPDRRHYGAGVAVGKRP